MKAMLKIKSRLNDGTVVYEFVSEVEMENNLAMWVRGTSDSNRALKFKSTDRSTIKAVIDTLLGGAYSDEGVVGVELIYF